MGREEQGFLNSASSFPAELLSERIVSERPKDCQGKNLTLNIWSLTIHKSNQFKDITFLQESESRIAERGNEKMGRFSIAAAG
jgi:hypothetical protein